MSAAKIRIKKSREGLFAAKAKRAGMGVQAFAKKVLAAPEGRYSPAARKQASFARSAKKWN